MTSVCVDSPTARIVPGTMVGLLLLLAAGCREQIAVPAPATRTTTPAVEEHESPRYARLPKSIVQPAARPAQPGDWFEDVTSQAGLKFQYDDGSSAGRYQLIESVGGGVALFDLDRDGDLDLFATGGGTISQDSVPVVKGRPGCLYRNLGEMQFEDVTEQFGLLVSNLFTHGVAAGDYDADGYSDLLVAGFGGVQLFHNEQGQRFTDVTASSGIAAPGWNVSALFSDVDTDGKLDVLVMTYADWVPSVEHLCINDQGLIDICGPTHFEGAGEQLFRNVGEGRFENVTATAGFAPPDRSLGLLAADLNADGHIDYYVANDVQENRLYLGQGQLPFSEEAMLQGVAVSVDGQRQGSMGVDAADFDRDGRLDLFYANYATEDNSLLRSTDSGFVDVTAAWGLIGVSRPWVGFGCTFADFDSDGWQDLMISNGHVAYERKDSAYLQPAQLFRNTASRFQDMSSSGGPYFSVPHAGRGLAVGDLDNDGALDVVASHQSEPVRLLRNKLPAGNWVRATLRATRSCAEAVGARASLLNVDGPPQVRWVLAGGSYLSHSDRRILLTLPPEAQAAAIEVVWPDGHRERFDALAPRNSHELVQGTGVDIH